MQNNSGLSLRRVVCAAGAGLLLMLGSPYGPPNGRQAGYLANGSAAETNRAPATRVGINAATTSNRLVALTAKLQRTRSSRSAL